MKIYEIRNKDGARMCSMRVKKATSSKEVAKAFHGIITTLIEDTVLYRGRTDGICIDLRRMTVSNDGNVIEIRSKKDQRLLGTIREI